MYPHLPALPCNVWQLLLQQRRMAGTLLQWASYNDQEEESQRWRDKGARGLLSMRVTVNKRANAVLASSQT